MIMGAFEQARSCQQPASGLPIKHQASLNYQRLSEGKAMDKVKACERPRCNKIVINIAKVCAVLALLTVYNQLVVYQIESVSIPDFQIYNNAQLCARAI